MRILVTAGNTQTPIDRVRCITNIFSGRTGTSIAVAARRREHSVTLMTSHPELVPGDLRSQCEPTFQVRPYRTFEDLQLLMSETIRGEHFDSIVHCAAVSDYELSGVYAPAPQSFFDETDRRWVAADGNAVMTDVRADKVKSHHDELWMRLTRTPKLIDQIRTPWGFTGTLVKFKLEVGVTDNELLRIAEYSRRQSAANLIVANTLEGLQDWAYLGSSDGAYQRVLRQELAERLLDQIKWIVGEYQATGEEISRCG